MQCMSENLKRMSRDPQQVSALLRMVFRLMEKWQLDARQQATLLGVRSTSTVYRWRNHGAKRLREETLQRIAHLLAIQKLLRLLFPRNPELREAWVRARNKAARFGGKRPIDIMLRGEIADLLIARSYLEDAAAG